MEGGRAIDDGGDGGAVGRAAVASGAGADAEDVVRVSRAWCGCRGRGAGAEGVVRSAFFKTCQALGRFRDKASFRPWLLRIVMNETRNTLRSADRARTVTGRLRRVGAHRAPAPLARRAAE
ncbi:RNA polymerase sigma factor [Streptomyces sp. NBC_01341]|uniref:RNA polymerase sigma factor n=1 Tax=Streptomyces sp. NBC_01341 TaxID=2903831 RepID=UPI002E0E0EC5